MRVLLVLLAHFQEPSVRLRVPPAFLAMQVLFQRMSGRRLMQLVFPAQKARFQEPARQLARPVQMIATGSSGKLTRRALGTARLSVQSIIATAMYALIVLRCHSGLTASRDRRIAPRSTVLTSSTTPCSIAREDFTAPAIIRGIPASRAAIRVRSLPNACLVLQVRFLTKERPSVDYVKRARTKSTTSNVASV